MQPWPYSLQVRFSKRSMLCLLALSDPLAVRAREQSKEEEGAPPAVDRLWGNSRTCGSKC